LFTVCGATFASTSWITKSPRDVCTVTEYLFEGSMVLGGGDFRFCISRRRSTIEDA
jgi:hypothetical protein